MLHSSNDGTNYTRKPVKAFKKTVSQTKPLTKNYKEKNENVIFFENNITNTLQHKICNPSVTGDPTKFTYDSIG